VEEDMKKPDFAASVWSDGDWIYAEIPSTVGGHSHTLKFPNDLGGLAQVLYLVRIRDTASKLGTRKSPTQHQVDLGEFNPKRIKKAKIKKQLTEDQMSMMESIAQKLGM
jgi:hypothetical protein